MQDLFEAVQERNKSINQVTQNASPDYKDTLITAVYRVLDAQETFTADDVWKQMERFTLKGFSQDPRALGGVLRQFCKEKAIRSTGSYRPSVRRHCAPLVVWERC